MVQKLSVLDVKILTNPHNLTKATQLIRGFLSIFVMYMLSLIYYTLNVFIFISSKI